jgi:hypothetical protein
MVLPTPPPVPLITCSYEGMFSGLSELVLVEDALVDDVPPPEGLRPSSESKLLTELVDEPLPSELEVPVVLMPSDALIALKASVSLWVMIDSYEGMLVSGLLALVVDELEELPCTSAFAADASAALCA